MINILTGIIEKTETGYSSYLKEVDGVIATGETIQEVKNNLLEAVAFHIEGYELLDLKLPELLSCEYKIDFISNH